MTPEQEVIQRINAYREAQVQRIWEAIKRNQPHDWRETSGQSGFRCADCDVFVTRCAEMQLAGVCPISYDRNWAQPMEPPCTRA